MPPGSQGVYQEGFQNPANAFVSGYPTPPVQPLGSVAPPRTWGYELRWYGADGSGESDDGFLFASPQAAEQFAKQEASLRCRREASTPTEQVAHAPPGARDVRWINALGYTETDVSFARGRYGYRVILVAEQLSATTDQETVDWLACRLPQADC